MARVLAPEIRRAFRGSVISVGSAQVLVFRSFLVAGRFVATFVGALLALALVAQADDEPGSQDHPLIGRYQDSRIAFYKTAKFDEAALLQAPHDFSSLLDRNAVGDRSGKEWLRIEGKVTKIRYEIPVGRSSLEVFRNYEETMKSGGFEIVYQCSDQSCFEGKLNDPYLLGQQIDTDNGVTTLYFDHARYMLIKMATSEGDIYASILTGQYQQQITAFVLVVETKAMESGKIEVMKAAEMAKAIKDNRKVNIYGILFDTDKHNLRKESKLTLDEIASLLTDQPDLRLEIVGHTDDQGAAAYNLALSQRRAASVVSALTLSYGIAPDRLSASGAGLTQPVASNDTAEGQAKNRRVELVAK